jgi:hypothetical protein
VPSVVAFAALKLCRTRFALTASAWLRHAKPVRAKRGAGGGTRTHTMLKSMINKKNSPFRYLLHKTVLQNSFQKFSLEVA